MTRSRSTILMAPALAWLTALMVVPCALVLALAFFRRGIYGGIEYTFTVENFELVFDPLYAGIFLNSARIAGLATVSDRGAGAHAVDSPSHLDAVRVTH